MKNYSFFSACRMTAIFFAGYSLSGKNAVLPIIYKNRAAERGIINFAFFQICREK